MTETSVRSTRHVRADAQRNIDLGHSPIMVALLIDGLCYGARPPPHRVSVEEKTVVR
jgi:hypothetical protein